MSKPADRRIAAIDATIERFLAPDSTVRTDLTRDEVAAAIRPLAELGRTGRWYNAVRTWECMVRDEDHNLGWALLQGAIRATHAA